MIIISTEHGKQTLDRKNILYIEHYNRCLYVHLLQGDIVKSKVLHVSFTKQVEPLLNTGEFVKPHQSFVVNMRAISNISNDRIILIDHSRIPIASRRKQAVMTCFDNFISKDDRITMGSSYQSAFLPNIMGDSLVGVMILTEAENRFLHLRYISKGFQKLFLPGKPDVLYPPGEYPLFPFIHGHDLDQVRATISQHDQPEDSYLTHYRFLLGKDYHPASSIGHTFIENSEITHYIITFIQNQYL